MLFSDRKEIADKIENSIKENNIRYCVLSVVTILDHCGLLKEKPRNLNIMIPNHCDPYEYISSYALKFLGENLDDAIAVLTVDGSIYKEYMQLDCRDCNIHYNFDHDWYKGNQEVIINDIIPLQYVADSRRVII